MFPEYSNLVKNFTIGLCASAEIEQPHFNSLCINYYSISFLFYYW